MILSFPANLAKAFAVEEAAARAKEYFSDSPGAMPDPGAGVSDGSLSAGIRANGPPPRRR